MSSQTSWQRHQLFTGALWPRSDTFFRRLLKGTQWSGEWLRSGPVASSSTRSDFRSRSCKQTSQTQLSRSKLATPAAKSQERFKSTRATSQPHRFRTRSPSSSRSKRTDCSSSRRTATLLRTRSSPALATTRLLPACQIRGALQRPHIQSIQGRKHRRFKIESWRQWRCVIYGLKGSKYSSTNGVEKKLIETQSESAKMTTTRSKACSRGPSIPMLPTRAPGGKYWGSMNQSKHLLRILTQQVQMKLSVRELHARLSRKLTVKRWSLLILRNTAS